MLFRSTILLANSIVDGIVDQETFGGLDITVRRNAFGRQVDSFEQELEMKGVGRMNAVFIRAPWVEVASSSVNILAEVSIEGLTHPVAVQQGRILATSFHPELTGDYRVHRYFVTEVCKIS